jgi:hypothetical protein
VGLGVEHISHERDDDGLRNVQVGHSHSVEGGVLGGSSSSVRSITWVEGIVLVVGLGVGLTSDVGVVRGGRDEVPGGCILEGPAAGLVLIKGVVVGLELGVGLLNPPAVGFCG